MDRKDIFNNIVESFSKKYDWLGESFSKEFLYSVASYNLEVESKPEFRIRRHLLLFFPAGWYKTTLLVKAYKLLGEQLCTTVSDISNAALRGTVEAGQFVTPFTLKRPFTVCTEFGQITAGSDSELNQKLLNVLEEGILTVSLGKLAFLSKEQKEKAINDCGITFIDNNTFTYKTNWVLLAGTYNKKFLVDSAFESRFVVLTPQQKLDGKLTRHVVNSPPFFVDEETKLAFRNEIFSPLAIDTNIKLPEEIYDIQGITPRDCGNLLSYTLCRSWWNLETTDQDIIGLAKQYRNSREELWKSADDKVFACLEFGSKTAKQIAEETELTLRMTYYALKSIRAVRIINSEGESVWKL